ncbi:MAG: RluA family pseudouridine synthase [Chlamydiae bacterium CG10_big_fil_rev_8_21_14_0_10_35_9]|nr:MAG: RluA family pseudouridine synthase [Chlamydiae bacterium CG10_big_fil_rev_8_21_14_0_10_35_9]
METETIIVSDDEKDMRIDKLLSNRFEIHSRSYFQYLIENQCVLLNGQVIKKRAVPSVGDEISIFFQLTEEILATPENIPLNILFEDEHIIAINKPASMVTHPAVGNRTKTFVNALLYHCSNLAPSEDPLRPGIVHRLDKDTTGVLIAAKTVRAHQALISQFSNRKIEKQYLAICLNHLENQKVDAPIARHPVKRKEMAVVENGKQAITCFQTIAFQNDLSLVLAKPVTGRTHQIRVHLKHINHPILGDATYGSAKANKKYHVERQLLHAYKLQFTHPITNVAMEIVAPIPEDMKKIIMTHIKN